jgi:3-carboxy-cis,cis-muconate cycloisomerase
MSVTPLDSPLFGHLLSDAELQGVFADATLLAEMVSFERALARVQGRLGVIPAGYAASIDAALEGYTPEPAALAEGTEAAGMPVPAFVAACRAEVGGPAADFVHYGATSQDVLDTAQVAQYARAAALLDRRLAALVDELAGLAETHRGTVMTARTRWQPAAPTTFGLKAAGWLAPLVRQRIRLAELRPRAFALACGGAAGTMDAFGPAALEIEAALAAELELPVAELPWHAQRDRVIEFGLWAAQLAGALGKIAQDVMLLAQGEIAELAEGAADDGRGGSSTLPQKRNPVGAETVLALARHAAGLASPLQLAALHAQERDGAAWAQEWLALPQLVTATGAALARMQALVAGLEVDAARMRANLEASNGLVLAEAASFALARELPREEALAAVKAACAEVRASGRHLCEVLAETTDTPIDWADFRDPARHTGAADALVGRMLRETGAAPPRAAAGPGG